MLETPADEPREQGGARAGAKLQRLDGHETSERHRSPSEPRAETFQGILSGDINPASAMMSGKLNIDGDMGLAMALGNALA